MLGLAVKVFERRQTSSHRAVITDTHDAGEREGWRMPPLASLPPARLSAQGRVWMTVLRGYLAIAAGLLLFKLVHLAA